MNYLVLPALLMLGVLSAQLSRAQGTADSPPASSAQASNAAAEDPLLSEFVDPELKFAEGCGCYLKRPGAAGSDGLVFFGKLGDRKESGWICLRGKITELPKEAHTDGPEIGKNMWVRSYRSSDVAVRVELVRVRLTAEGTGTYTGELTVSSGGRAERMAVTGICGC